MTKLPNIIQRRELEPLLLKADKIAKYYEKAANCAVCVIRPEPPDNDTGSVSNQIHCLCKHCSKKNEFYEKHMEAVIEAKKLGGSHIYVCPAGHVFWASPIFSGERFAGALISGCEKEAMKNSGEVKALANMMLICADQISRGVSRIGDAALTRLENPDLEELEAADGFADEFADEFAGEGETEIDFKTENNSYLMDLERILMANLRRGDTIEAEKILNNLLLAYYKSVNSNLLAFRLKALELAVLLSRAASEPNDMNDSSILETNNRYLNKINESTSFQEIKEILLSFTEKMSVKIFSFHGVRHFSALRKAERYIWENCTRKLSLREIAGVSGLSAPYFSTIFREEMGENLSNYLNRLRVEKASIMLITTNVPINKIAKICGFEDQSWFSKIFKIRTGLTPGKYRDQGSISGISA